MAVPVTELQDSMIVAKAFERGANHSITEESVFAVMTPRLGAMRSTAKAIKGNMTTRTSDSQNANLSQPANPSASVATATSGGIQNNKTSGKSDLGDKIRECIPCKVKINFKEKFDIATLLDPAGLINQFATSVTHAQRSFLEQCLKEINQAMDLFRNPEKYVDLCAFRKMLTENVCIPDLQRMMAMLTAFLMKLSLEINSIFGSIVSLFGPILLPFLTGLVDTLMKFVMAAIKPIECVVEAMQRFLSKMDYNVLFQNIDNLQVAGLSIAAPGAAAQRNSDLKEIDQADEEIKKLQEASSKISVGDTAAREKNQEKLTKAKERRNKAESKRNTSAVGRSSQAIGEQFGSMKGALVGLITMVRRAASELEAYVKKVVDEIMSLINSFMGGGQESINKLNDKLQIVQFLAMIAAIIKAIKNKSVCEDEGQEPDVFLNQLNLSSAFSIWTDEDGTVHIEEKDDVNAAIEDVVKAFGVPAGSADNRQKLKSLVQFTGNPTLDSSISRAVEGLTTPLRVKFKCPLKTSVADAEQVNTWMRELDAET
mgnify:CR=1 FL=1